MTEREDMEVVHAFRRELVVRVSRGRKLGTGVLLAPRVVATCWHVVREDAPASVTHGEACVDVARVLRHPPIGELSGAEELFGDLALLELAEPLEVAAGFPSLLVGVDDERFTRLQSMLADRGDAKRILVAGFDDLVATNGYGRLQSNALTWATGILQHRASQYTVEIDALDGLTSRLGVTGNRRPGASGAPIWIMPPPANDNRESISDRRWGRGVVIGLVAQSKNPPHAYAPSSDTLARLVETTPWARDVVQTVDAAEVEELLWRVPWRVARQEEWLEAPFTELRGLELPGFSLLDARHRVVPMSGREDELADWSAWCEGDETAARLLTGKGGAGKTRLLRELCEQQRRAGWHAGFLRRDMMGLGESQADEPPEGEATDGTAPTPTPGPVRGVVELDRLARAGRRVLLVVDYAETWGDDLLQLLKRLGPHVERGRVRLVMIARGQAEWWKALVEASPVEWKGVLQRPSIHHALGPVREDREVACENAARAFADRLGKPARTDASLLEQADDTVLSWHTAALLAVDPDQPGRETAEPGVRGLYDRLVRREAWKHWTPKARALGLGKTANLDDVLRTVACVAALVGPVRDKGEARRVLAGASGLGGMSEATVNALSRVFAELYPTRRSGDAKRWVALPALVPDRVGEWVAVSQLGEEPGLLGVAFGEEAAAESPTRGLRVLGRATGWLGEARALVGRALSEHAERAWTSLWNVAPTEASGEALAEVAEGVEMSPGQAWLRLSGAPEATVVLLNVKRTLAKRALQEAGLREEKRAQRLLELGGATSAAGAREDALHATREAVDLYRRLAKQQPDAFEPGLATSLHNLGKTLSAVGRREDALHATREAVDLDRRLAKRQPDAFEPDLAGSLNNLGAMLSAVGRREDALHATREAVDLYRRLAKRQPDAFEPHLARSLNNLGLRHSEVGRREEALHATREAVDIRRRLAKQQPDAFEPDLASSLTNLGIRLSAAGRRENALQAALEARELYRRLAKRQPDAFEPNLAASLNNLGRALSEAGRREDALHATREAVDIRRRLAKQQPDAFEPDLAGSLHNLGKTLSAVGRREDALHATREAVDLYRRLAKRQPDAFEPDLAGSLHNLGLWLSAVGRREEALHATREAVDIRRRLAERQPDAFEPDLARSLHNLGSDLSEVGRREVALHATREAVDLYRRLAKRQPDAFEPDLAGSLHNLGLRHSEVGRREEALHATRESVDIRRRLAKQQPDAFEPDLAASLNNLGLWLSAVGRREEALHATREAVDLHRRLAKRQPDAFEPDLAGSLNNLGSDLSEVGQREDALHATREAVDLYRRLAKQQPDALEPDLAMSLHNLGKTLSAVGRREDALHARREAVDLYRRLAERQPDAFEPDLAMSLHNHGKTLWEVGRREEALHATREAVDIRRRLAKQQPDAFEPDLARSLINLGLFLSALRQPGHEALEEAIAILTPWAERFPDAFGALLEKARAALASSAS